jgi:hypothetical protein
VQKACLGGLIPTVRGFDTDPCASADKAVEMVVAFEVDCVLYQHRLEVPYLMVGNILAHVSLPDICSHS